MGILGIIISLLWWIHILLHMVLKKNGFPMYSFLNKILIYFEDYNATFLSTFLLAGFSMYLLWCTAKGNFKVKNKIS